MFCRIPSIDDKLPQATTTHNDSIDDAGQVNSHLSIGAHTGKNRAARHAATIIFDKPLLPPVDRS